MQAESKPNLRVIQGGLSENPQRDLPESQVEPVLKKPGFAAGIRRGLSKITEKLKASGENSEPGWGKGF
jgi:hypothetical protein